MFAPIVLFCYKRLDKTINCINSLKTNPEFINSDLIIYSDGPKSPAEYNSVEVVRDYIQKINGFKSLKVIHRAENLGLAQSIITGLSDVINEKERAIILEDDLIVSPFFLKYMNEALEMYENCNEVISIHGYSYPVSGIYSESFLLRGADCWGWATWKRGWKKFRANASELLKEIEAKNLSYQFDFDGTFGFTQMLRDQVHGKIDSWAIRWHASAFLADNYTLYPGRSLVQNHGFDDTGKHCSSTNIYDVTLANREINLVKLNIKESIRDRELIKDYFVKRFRQKSSIFRKILNRIKNFKVRFLN